MSQPGRSQMSIWIPTDLKRQLHEYGQARGMTDTAVLVFAVTELLLRQRVIERQLELPPTAP